MCKHFYIKKLNHANKDACNYRKCTFFSPAYFINNFFNFKENATESEVKMWWKDVTFELDSFLKVRRIKI